MTDYYFDFDRPFIIAEAGINHNGDLDIAKKMVDAAKTAGADAIKFQTFKAEEFINDKTLTYTYKSQGKTITESMLDMFKRYEISKEQWGEIKNYCEKNNIMFFSTPQNKSDLNLLLELGVDIIKVGSDDFVNLPLLQYYASKQLPLILSCGMAYEHEIDTVIENIYGINNNLCVLLCTSEYPTPYEDVNVSRITTLKNKYPYITFGFSDHTQGDIAAVMAVSLGAKVFEKHFTLDNDMPGPDHWFSENPDSLKLWIDSIRQAYECLGNGIVNPSSKELEMRDIAQRSIFSSKSIKMGEYLSDDNLELKRPGTGMNGLSWDKVIGCIATHDIDENSLINEGDFIKG